MFMRSTYYCICLVIGHLSKLHIGRLPVRWRGKSQYLNRGVAVISQVIRSRETWRAPGAQHSQFTTISTGSATFSLPIFSFCQILDVDFYPSVISSGLWMSDSNWVGQDWNLYYNKTDLVSVRDKISQRLEIRLPCGYGQKQGLVFPLAEKHITF
jgi:hypothetical protein